MTRRVTLAAVLAPAYREVVLAPGDPAPDFAIGDTTLHRLLKRHEVVVFFFPKAFTPGWTREAGGFRRVHEELRAAGTELVGVSGDTQKRNDEFRASLELPYPLVGDADGRILAAYDVSWPIVRLAHRVSYLVGQDRRVRWAFKNERAAEAHVSEACAFVAGKRA